MREINKFIVHCSASPNDRDIGAAEIYKMHVDGNGWSDIGYHYIIRRDGRIEFGRPIEKIGAHVRGENTGSVGVCLIGLDDFTVEQFASLKALWQVFKLINPDITQHGHRDFTNQKTCPNFEVRDHLA